jgi:hypothetical protein
VAGVGILVAGGLCVSAVGSALAVEAPLGGVAASLAIGVAATAALVAADGSWWLRRDAKVDRAVFASIARRVVPAWLAGGAMVVAAIRFATGGQWTIWFLPAAIAAAAALTALAGYAIGRGREHRLAAAPRRRDPVGGDLFEWDPDHR